VGRLVWTLHSSASGTAIAQGLALPFTRWRFPDANGKYALSFAQLPGTVVVDSEPYTQWLMPGKWQFYLVRDANVPASRPCGMGPTFRTACSSELRPASTGPLVAKPAAINY
jgi:hypothetical protein